MKILFIASECVPFCKTGGLADVVGALPKELRKKRHDVRVILPKYKSIRGQEFGLKETGEGVRLTVAGRLEAADIRTAKTERGVKVYFINHEGYFGRAGLYQNAQGDYSDNAERFAFFSRAALEASKAIEFRPDVVHAHDWQTGLVPVYLKTLYRHDAFFQHTASVLTLHNMAYQGIFPKELLDVVGLTWNEFTMDKVEFYDQINFLKGGIAYADMLTTVSPTYASQIQEAYEYGRGLEGTIRNRSSDLVGILNGLDTDEWNPAKDPFLAKPFEASAMNGRRDCKISLQESLRLPASLETPVLGVVARLDPQKGVDLLLEILPALMRRGTQVVVLGQGDRDMQTRLERMQRQHPTSFRTSSEFNDPLAHHIYGGCDMFLMPSRFEPCGLGQMIAMRYGAIPVVASTGGLRDTVRPAGSESGTGFLFEPGSSSAFLAAIDEALAVYADRPRWSALQARAMNADYSWDLSSQRYVQVYRRALGRKSPSTTLIRIL
ncbi:MAG TPA: glycogen synthase GlgA [Elusimicrobiota bacterium]|nr:glycogen synthase GlgA [Elusimicrobiota bacterium]